MTGKINTERLTRGIFIAEIVLKSTAVARFKLHQGLSEKYSAIGNCINLRNVIVPNLSKNENKPISKILAERKYCHKQCIIDVI